MRRDGEPLAVLPSPAVGVAAVRLSTRIFMSCALRFLIATSCATCFSNAARSTSDLSGEALPVRNCGSLWIGVEGRQGHTISRKPWCLIS